MRKPAFTLVELVISVGLLIVAMSIALFATIGSSGLIQKTDSRGAVTEGARTLSDTIRRTAVNAPVGAVSLEGTKDATDNTYSAVRIKSFATDQAQTACYVIGRATALESNGQELYQLDPDGDTAAMWVYSVDSGGFCPDPTSENAIYQNRLNDRQTKLTEFRAIILSYPCAAALQSPTCRSKQQLRIWGTIELLRKINTGSTAEARQPSLSFETSIPIGLVNEAQHELIIDTLALNNGIVNLPYEANVTASGGSPGYSFTLVNGTTLPSGLSLDADGRIHGTPNAQQTKNFDIQVTDSLNTTSTRSLSITINGSSSAVTIISSSPLSPGATELQSPPYTFQFDAIGAPGYTWALQNTPPAWLQISSSGLLSGTPPNGSNPSVTITVRATDANNPTNYDARSFVLPIADNSSSPSLTIDTASPLSPGATEQQNPAYTRQFQASGGSGGYAWSLVAGTYPAWMAINSSGLLTATPPAGSAPQATFRVRVIDSSSTVQTKDMVLPITGGVIEPPPKEGEDR